MESEAAEGIMQSCAICERASTCEQENNPTGKWSKRECSEERRFLS